MRILTIAAAVLALTSCASAVYDSLERRGVDSRAVFTERVSDARGDISAAKSGLASAVAALDAVGGLDGAALARQLDRALAAEQDAAIAVQDLRLSSARATSAGGRFFADWAEEIRLYQSAADRDSATARMAAATTANRQFSKDVEAAGLRLSPALSLLDNEISTLRRSATSSALVAARASERERIRRAAADAASSLDAAAKAADTLLTSVK